LREGSRNVKEGGKGEGGRGEGGEREKRTRIRGVSCWDAGGREVDEEALGRRVGVRMGCDVEALRIYLRGRRKA
jgi:hypothetical protein